MAVDHSFESCLLFALDKLNRREVSLKEEQRLAVKAIYDRKDTFLCASYGIWQEPVLPDSSFRDGLQA